MGLEVFQLSAGVVVYPQSGTLGAYVGHDAIGLIDVVDGTYVG